MRALKELHHVQSSTGFDGCISYLLQPFLILHHTRFPNGSFSKNADLAGKHAPVPRRAFKPRPLPLPPSAVQSSRKASHRLESPPTINVRSGLRRAPQKQRAFTKWPQSKVRHGGDVDID